MFWCAVDDASDRKQVYFQIEDAKLSRGIGMITLSHWAIPSKGHHYEQSSDCGIVNGPCRQWAGPKWIPFAQAQVAAKIFWERNNGRPVVAGIQVDMGRSGTLQAMIVKPFDHYDSAPGRIVSRIMGFNYPQGTQASSCHYFKALGPRPGLTGSN
jgi:hypothetical protein